MPELPGATASLKTSATKIPLWYFIILAILTLSLTISLGFLYLDKFSPAKQTKPGSSGFLAEFSLPVDFKDPAVKGNYLSYELTGTISNINKEEAAKQSVWTIKTGGNNQKYQLKVPWETVAFTNLAGSLPRPNYKPSETYVKEDAKVGDQVRLFIRTDIKRDSYSVDQILNLSK